MIIDEFNSSNNFIMTFVMSNSDSWLEDYINNIIPYGTEFDAYDIPNFDIDVTTSNADRDLYDRLESFIESNYPDIELDTAQFEYPECEMTIWLAGDSEIINSQEFINDIDNFVNNGSYMVDVSGDVQVYYEKDKYGNIEYEDVDVSGQAVWDDFVFKGIEQYN